MDGLKFPEWQQALQDAILERDGNTLHDKIESAEGLVFLRFLHLQDETNCIEERKALTDALYLLRLLRRNHVRPNQWNFGSG